MAKLAIHTALASNQAYNVYTESTTILPHLAPLCTYLLHCKWRY